MQRWGLFWQILSIFKNRPKCTSDRFYTGMYNWTFSECYIKAVMMVRLYMRPIIFIDMRFIPICTVRPVVMGHAIYFHWSNCTQPNQPVQKVGCVDIRGRKLRKCTLPPGMASRVQIFALAQRYISMFLLLKDSHNLKLNNGERRIPPLFL
jgi:hypothetical protein